MDNRRRLWLLVPEPIRRFPADLTVTVILAVLTCLIVLLTDGRWTLLKVAFGLITLLFLPGYALVAGLFPEKDRSQSDGGLDPLSPFSGDYIGGFERVVLSFGLSLAVVPLIGLALNFTPVGIRPLPVVLSVCGFTVGAAIVAAVRRWELPPRDRFRIPYKQWYSETKSWFVDADTSTTKVLNVALAISMLLAVGSVAYAVGSPKPSERYTEFYLLSTDEDGELIADDYPTEYVQGEGQQLVVGIGNREREPTNYTVVVELQRVDGGNGSGRITAERELHRFQVVLDTGETWTRNHTVAPSMTGDNLRLQYLLYRGEAPSNPRVENAYRDVNIPINVNEPLSLPTDFSVRVFASR